MDERTQWRRRSLETGTYAGTEGAAEGSVFPIHDAQQLPVLPHFKGATEDAEEDSSEEWVDRLEEMGVCCRCDDHKKLTQVPLDSSTSTSLTVSLRRGAMMLLNQLLLNLFD
uniref:Uncharacterized protein n=1 Tax=Amphimedon queenslandica TaxID=400682 RepID=A0A1X7VQU3_AMPQE